MNVESYQGLTSSPAVIGVDSDLSFKHSTPKSPRHHHGCTEVFITAAPRLAVETAVKLSALPGLLLYTLRDSSPMTFPLRSVSLLVAMLSQHIFSS